MKPNEALLYAATSANLYNFMGNSDFDNHLEAFKAILRNSVSAFKDLFDFSVDQVLLEDKDNVFSRLKTMPRIFISFHTGSYYSLISLLLRSGHEVIVMSDTQSVKSGDYDNVTEIFRRQYNNDCRVEMVNVEEQGAIFALIRKIRKGAIVIAFIDGNKGVGGQTMNNENMINIKFLSGTVRVRKGIAYLSYLTKVPIQLALSYKDEMNTYVRIYEDHNFSFEMDKEVFAREVLQYIFCQFESYIRTYWIQWANWPYLHNWSLIEKFSEVTPQTLSGWVVVDDKWKLNFVRYCPFKLENGCFLFDRFRYSFVPVNERYVKLFSYKSTDNERRSLVDQITKYDHQMVDQLVSRNILVAV